MPFPSDWVEYPDGSMGPPGIKQPSGTGQPRMPRGPRDPRRGDSPIMRMQQVPGPVNDFISLPTVYRGIQFRSRIEARWAVIFDFLHLTWEFEPEYYDLGPFKYLPDFWLVELDCWVEIKGPHPTEFEQAKARALARHTKKPCYIFCCGIPRIAQDGAPVDFQCGESNMAHGYRYDPSSQIEGMGYSLGVKECCGAIGIVQDAQTPRIDCGCGVEAEWDEGYLTTLQVAFMRGRKARWD